MKRPTKKNMGVMTFRWTKGSDLYPTEEIIGLVHEEDIKFNKSQKFWSELENLAEPLRSADCYIRTYTLSKLNRDIDKESFLRMFDERHGPFQIIFKRINSVLIFYGYVLSFSHLKDVGLREITLREYRLE